MIFRIASVITHTVLIVGMLSSCYLAHATRGQVSLLWNRQPIDKVLAEPNLDTNTKAKLLHVREVRAWAREKLGLSGRSFETLSRIDRKAVAWNVTASRELAFVPKTWWFPIVGTVPYLGFFSEDKAEKEAKTLREEGWDVLIQEVAGYSTLGWFQDPLVSTQLAYPDWYLTRLVIHETTHATVWIPGSVDFNESFASFVELEGALQYAREKEGEDSPSYKRKLAFLAESEIMHALLHDAAKGLESIYHTDLPDDAKRNKKAELISELKSDLKRRKPQFHALNSEAYAMREYNNADFLSFLRYESGDAYFRGVFEDCKREWPCFLDVMKKLKAPPEHWKEPRKNAIPRQN